MSFIQLGAQVKADIKEDVQAVFVQFTGEYASSQSHQKWLVMKRFQNLMMQVPYELKKFHVFLH